MHVFEIEYRILIYFLFQRHQTTCLYVEVHCMNDGCEKELLRKDINNHEEDCPFRLIQCQYCYEEVSFNNLEVY